MISELCKYRTPYVHARNFLLYNIIIAGMKLCACSMAVTDFKKIVSVVGGAGEQQRAE